MKCETGDLQNAAARAECCEFWGMCCCWSCSFAGKCNGTANVILLQLCKEECKLPDCIPCIMLWNWIIIRPYFCDRKPKTGPRFSGPSLFCRDLLWQTCSSCSGHGVVLFVMWLSPAFGKSCLRWGWARDRHHYLKICGCLTDTVYPPTLPPGWVWFLKYLYILLSAVYWRLSRQVFSRGDKLTSQEKKSNLLKILFWKSSQKWITK